MATPACLAAGWGWSAAYYQDLLTVSFGPERAISPVQPVIIRVIRPTSLSAAASCIRANIRVIIRVMLLTSCHLCIIWVSWTLGTHMTLATSLLSTSQQIGEYGEGTGAGGLELYVLLMTLALLNPNYCLSSTWSIHGSNNEVSHQLNQFKEILTFIMLNSKNHLISIDFMFWKMNEF